MVRRGFTLVELLVVIGIIGVLVALLLPSIRVAREPARRMQCGNNLKQLCLGLQNYHDIFLSFPYGARERTTESDDEPSFGPSWLVATLPFCEQRPLYDKLSRVDEAAAANDYQSAAVRQVAHNAKIKMLLCPSSPLPETHTVDDFVLVLPSYAGIMGASDHDVAGKERTVDEKQRFVSGPFGGIAAANGMLPINEAIKFTDCTDGTANTLLVGEISDWYYDGVQASNVKRRNPAAASEASWLAGTNLSLPIRNECPPVSGKRIFNLVTIAHPVGINNRQGDEDPHPNWQTGGIGPGGLNNPLLSAHPAGAMVGYLDGHIGLITKQTDVYVVKRLAMRDDGGMLPDFN